MTARPVSMDRLFEKNSLSHHRRTFRRLLRVTFILLLLIVVLSPFYVAVLYAFKPATEITANRLAFSKNPTLENFHNVIFENELFGIGFKNSVINTIPTVLILMGFTSMAAWVLARYDSRVYRLIYAVLTLGLLIPFQCFELPLQLVQHGTCQHQHRFYHRPIWPADFHQHGGGYRLCQNRPPRAGTSRKH